MKLLISLLVTISHAKFDQLSMERNSGMVGHVK